MVQEKRVLVKSLPLIMAGRKRQTAKIKDKEIPLQDSADAKTEMEHENRCDRKVKFTSTRKTIYKHKRQLL